MCLYVDVHTTACIWKSEINCVKLKFFSFHHKCPGDQTHIPKPSIKHPYLLTSFQTPLDPQSTLCFFFCLPRLHSFDTTSHSTEILEDIIFRCPRPPCIRTHPQSFLFGFVFSHYETLTIFRKMKGIMLIILIVNFCYLTHCLKYRGQGSCCVIQSRLSHFLAKHFYTYLCKMGHIPT